LPYFFSDSDSKIVVLFIAKTILLLKALQLLVILIVAACNSPRPDTAIAKPATNFQRIDSLAFSKPDSAFYYYNEAARNSNDRGYKGWAYQKMAVIQQNAGDYFGSLETTLNSLALFDPKNKEHFPNISFNYNLLANNCLNLGNYDDAIRFHDLAFQYSDRQNMPTFQNNKGVAYQKKREYGQAIAIFETALKESKQDSIVYARIRSNLAKARWLQNPAYPAAP
jgi:tetratricopeptide (TPR) repeat protein